MSTSPDSVNRRILIQKITNLPTLPSVIKKIIQEADNPNANADSVSAILARDPSISSLILRLVNSAFYGRFRHVSSINHAVVMLGFPMVKTIAMGVSVFESEQSAQDGLDRRALWLHSLGVATAAKALAESLPEAKLDQDQVFVSGLLHDLGKVIFDNYFHEEYVKVIALARKENLWIGEAEARLLQMNHAQAGYYLARKWQFPPGVVSAIHFHHELENCEQEFSVNCALVHAADYVCRSIKLGSGGDDQEPELDPLVRTHGITRRLLDKASEQLESNRAQLEAFISG